MEDHDGGYKLLFSHPRMVEELLRGFVHEPWVDELDFTTLETYQANLISDKQRQRHVDIVWRLRWRGNPEDFFYIYLLLEFQSKPDPFMAVRLLAYVGLLLGDIIRKRGITLATGLPVVLPLVLYNGRQPWNAPLDLASLFRVVPPGFERYLPQLTYHLVDESRLTAEDLDLPGNWVSTLFRLEAAQLSDLRGLVDEITERLPHEEEPDLHRAFLGWLYRVFRRLKTEAS